MGFSLHLRKISSKKQSSSRNVNESSPLHQSNPCPKDPDKLKPKASAGPECTDPFHKSRREAARKNREKNVKGSLTQSDELVKYMSNLPDYLQRPDKGENIKEKALNFGVLDWSRLEKWSNKQTHVAALYSSFTPIKSSAESSSRAATTSSSIAGGKKKLDDKKSLLSSDFKTSYKEGLPESSKVSSWEFESSVKTQSYSSLQKEKRNGYGKQTSLAANAASKSRHHGVSVIPKEYANNCRDSEAKRLEGLQQHYPKKKERNHKPSSPRRLTSLKSKNNGVSLSSRKNISSFSSEVKTLKEQFQESDTDVDSKQCHSKPSNIVLLRPRQDQQSSSSGYFELSQLKTSYDENVSVSSRSSSFTFIPEELCTQDVSSEIPHSRTLHSVSEPPSSTTSEPMQQCVNTDVDNDPSTGVSNKPACSDKMSSLHSEDKLCALNNMKESQDQETSELTDQIGRNASSNHKLSFSLDQIRRSFSLKERPTLPQLGSMFVSAMSGPLTSESSACLDNSIKEKAKGHHRTRSSPFVRLLDPILKHKTSNIHHSEENNSTAKGSFTPFNLQTEKSKGFPVQALLQLTVKNGVPLFKFVVNNERKVLAATMRSLASPEKEDGGCYFAFYLVNEIKKKSGGWMSHASKEKSCGYVYNMVGQMKFSSRKINETSHQNLKSRCMVKEYVLLNVAIDQTDQGPSAFCKRRELAAVVIEIPCENSSHEGLHKDNLLKQGCLKCLAEERCFCITGENDVYGTTRVILPGGVHSSPNRGEPSPLVQRWKSGGTCDCGGWDVGCKLLVLSNQKPGSNISRSTISHLDRFQLFVQEGAELNAPIFTLAPLKDGFYSVEFSSTIDHLQAFFISVAVLSSQKLPSSLEMSNMLEDITKEISSKDKNELQGKASLNYNPIPPLSPVGRV